jgi:TPR repeat protein
VTEYVRITSPTYDTTRSTAVFCKALTNYSMLLMEGIGGPQDLKRALELNEIGARKGDAYAFGILGSM